MSLTEHDLRFVEPPPVSFMEGDVPPLDWFSPSFLQSTNHHPLDDTIQYTTKRCFYVRWFDRGSEKRHDDWTASVTSLVGGPTHEGSSRMASTPLGVHDDRRSQGVRLHRWIECILNGFPLTAATGSLYQQVVEYHTTCLHDKQIPWRTEMAVRSSTCLRLVGVIDAIFTDAIATEPVDGVLVVHLKDWKYSRDVASCLPDYTKQLNLYKYILESHYRGLPFTVGGIVYTRIHVATMELVLFHETLATYRILRVPETQEALQTELQERKKCIRG